MISNPKVAVNLLGEFSITINGNQVTNLTGRTKRVWLLIQYLIANRNKEVLTEMLIKVLWGDGEGDCSDPLNALKNLVYRARELLKDIAQDRSAEFIEFAHGSYKWNNRYPCTIDTEQLINCWKLAQDSSQPDEARIESCKRAVTLYRGHFLPKSAYSKWVISAASYYTLLYNDCVLNGCSLLIDHKAFDEVIRICKTALSHTPLEESFHKMLLYAYISTNQRDKALEHYKEAADLFYGELGIDISETLLPVYKQMLGSIDFINVDLNVIKNDLKEGEPKGAYYCDYDIFKAVYRAQVRAMMRTGISIFLVLFSITDSGAGQDSVSLMVAGDKLKEAILSSLRKGDVVAPYSTSQYVVLLPVISYENAQKVVDRVLQKFRFLYRKNNLKVISTINAVDTVE
jgi:DNA-binding SARP family transcriptional activator